MNHTVVINSIGSATPRVSKVLSDVLKVPQEYMLRLLYNAPSVLFQKVDEDTALKAEDTLTKLGLEVSVCSKEDKVDLATELVEISVSFEDILQLPKVTEQLAEFLGCKQSEVINLLVNEPSIVLGNVSKATAEALGNRIDANVHFSNPKTDKYTVLISDKVEDSAIRYIEKLLKTKLQEKDGVFFVEEVSYNDSQLIWRKYQANQTVKLVNQSHQSVHLVLHDFDIQREAQVTFLVEQVGMPEDILHQVQEALPITLYENMNRQTASETLKNCESLGMSVTMEKNFDFKKKLKLTAIEDIELVTQILRQFIAEKDLPKKEAKEWTSANEIPPIIARYLCAQLEQVACEIEII